MAICLSDPRLRSLALSTLWLAGSVTVIAVPVGTLLACALVRTNMHLRRTFGLLLTVSLFLPLTIQAAAWQSGFGPQGVFTLNATGQWTAGQTLWLDGISGAIWVHAVASIPWVVVIVGLALCRVRPELEEEAMLDGSARMVLFQVTLPRSLAAVFVATIWVLVRTAGEMTVTDLFAVRTFAEEIYTQTILGASNRQLIETSRPGVLICTGLFILAVAACRRMDPRQRPANVRPPIVFSLRRWRWPVTIVVGGCVLFLALTPLVSLCSQAGIVVHFSGNERVRHWSLTKCIEVLAATPRIIATDVFWSLLIAACAATSALLIGIALAWLARRGDWRAAPAIITIALALAVPGSMIGAAIITLLNRPLLAALYDHSILAPWMAQTIHCLPLAILIPWISLRSVSTDTLRSAATDGAGPLTRLVKIAIASRYPAIAITWLVAFALAIGELASTVLVVPPRVTTLTGRIFDWLHYGANDQVAGVCLWMSALYLVIGFCVFRLMQRVDSA